MSIWRCRMLDETRELLLGVGIEMLYERGAGVSVGHIKLSDVVTAAGLTTGAAYRCWDNQEAFHRDPRRRRPRLA